MALFLDTNKVKFALDTLKIKKIMLDTQKIWSGEVAAGKIVFTESQIWEKPEGVNTVDIFLVGGGCAGNGALTSSNYTYGGSGGGSGTTKTMLNVDISQLNELTILIGSGSGDYYSQAGSSIISEISGAIAVGGENLGGGSQGGTRGGVGINTSTSNCYVFSYNQHGYTDGNGTGYNQGTTTKAFGEDNETMYASGGDGGWAGMAYGSYATSGNLSNSTLSRYSPNTGNGGSGGCLSHDSRSNTAIASISKENGSSGLIIIRWAKQ